MTWYNTGTVTVTPGSNAVIGVGTAFIRNARVGDGFRGPDGGWYEVINIASDTALSISPLYGDPSAYALAPLQGYVKDSADALREATKTIAGGVADMQEQVAAATEAAESAAQSNTQTLEQAGIATAAAETSANNKDVAQLAAQQSQASAQVAGEAATRSETARDSVIQSEQAAAASAMAAQESADRAEEVTEGKAASGSNNDITSLSGLTTPLSKAQGGTGSSDGIPVMVGATASAAGIPGLVPAGAAGDQEKFLTAGGIFKEAGGGDNIGDIKPWKFSRATIPGGRLPNDGQIVTNGRALYPEFWALIQPFCITDAVWLASPYDQRGKFSSGDGSTDFRMPDDNAKHPDGNTFGAMFLRGDGKNSAGTPGLHVLDQFQSHKHRTPGADGLNAAAWSSLDGQEQTTTVAAFFQSSTTGSYRTLTGGANFVDGANGTPRRGTETRPVSSTIIWCTTVAKTPANSGSVDVPALATAVSNQGAQIQSLPFTKFFESPQTTWAVGGLLTFNPGFDPKITQIECVVTVATANSAVGDRFDVPLYVNTNYQNAQVVSKSASAVTVRCASNMVRIFSNISGDQFTPTNSRMVMRCWG